MKALKIILVFALILGGAFGVLSLVRDDNWDWDIKVVFDDTTLEEHRKRITKAWKHENDWNEALFDKHCELIKQLSVRHQTSSLKDLNTSLAVEAVDAKIFEQWKKINCKKSVIDNYHIALDSIVRADENARSNPIVVNIRNVYKDYIATYKLSKRAIGLSVEFDGEKKDWNSYSDYAKRIEKQREQVYNNGNYKTYFCNITEIKKDLGDIDSKLSAGKRRFYESLADKIESYFSLIEAPENRTREQLNNLRNIISRYEKEYSRNSRLSDFATDYANDVNRNENNRL